MPRELMTPSKTDAPFLSVDKAPVYASGAAVEQHLAALQEHHRLAIHQWEEENLSSLYGLPRRTLSHLRAGVDSVAEGLKGHADDLPLFSLTLIPPAVQGRSVMPYGAVDYPPVQGYLFDLSQQGDNPPRVLRASVKGLVSGNNYFRKSLGFNKLNDEIPELQSYYRRFEGDEKAMRRYMGGPDGSKATEEQLDMLGDYLAQPALPFEIFTCPPDVLTYNELVTGVREKHIAAISIPLYQAEKRDRYYPHPKMPFLELQAAITGLEHLEAGIDKPVVFYHIDEKNKGTCTYFGQGKEMLTQKAREAIAKLPIESIRVSRNEDYHWLVEGREEIERFTGMDVLAPRSIQTIRNTPETSITAHTVQRQGSNIALDSGRPEKSSSLDM